MKRKAVLAAGILLLLSCNRSGWKKYGLDAFEISVPANWQFKSQKSIDSFAGEFVARKVDIGFDYSKQGLAASLLPTEKEYLDALWVNLWTSPEEDGQLFHLAEAEDAWRTARIAKNNIDARRRRDSLATGSVKKSVEIFKAIRPLKKGKPMPDYFAFVKYNGLTDTVTIRIPDEIKNESFKIDTNGKYIRKTMWPKKPGKGMTGIFVYRTDADFTFNMEGRDLSAPNQQLALKAFKTIKFK